MITWRQTVQHSDIQNVCKLAANTHVFSTEEIKVAGELVEECLQKGEDISGYSFLFVEEAGHLIGYTCFGIIPFTDHRYDLYWIAVDPQRQQKGLGKELLKRTEQIITQRGGQNVYAETSSRAVYLPTRNFYCRNDYQEIAVLPNFYSDGDSKVIYYKYLT